MRILRYTCSQELINIMIELKKKKKIYFKGLFYFGYKAMYNYLIFLNNSKVTIIKESEFVTMVP